MNVKIVKPLLPLRDIVVFPNMVIPLFVGRDKSISALNEVMKKDKKIILVTQKNSEVDDPKKTDVFEYGCEGNILQLLKLPDGTVKVLVEGSKRIKILDFKDNDKFIVCEYAHHHDVVTKDENGNKLDKSTIFIYTKKEKKKVDESKRPITLINGKSSCDGCVLELTKEKFAAIVLSVEKEKVVSFLIKFPKRPTLKIKNSTTLNKQAKTFLHEAEIGQMVQVFNLKSSESDLSSAPVIFKIVK